MLILEYRSYIFKITAYLLISTIVCFTVYVALMRNLYMSTMLEEDLVHTSGYDTGTQVEQMRNLYMSTMLEEDLVHTSEYGTGTQVEQMNRVKNKDVKVILWYGTHRQSMLVHSFKVQFSKCQFSDCQIKQVISKTDLKRASPFLADAIIVQSNAISTLPPPPRRDENQVFVLAVRDAFRSLHRAYTMEIASQWIHIFNWTMTFRLDSDIVYKYSNIIPRPLSKQTRKNYSEIFVKKTNDVLWLVSHCETLSRREDYVSGLRKVIGVDIFGHCGKTAPCPKGDHSCFKALAGKYKFYLAFENTLYPDYITEKVFNWFNRDIIIVGRAGSNYSRIMPPETVIDAADFDSPAQLGNFLSELAVDKDRYIAYLTRKDMFYSTNKYGPAEEAYCKLCEYLHTLENHRKTYSDIVKWWLP